MVAAKRDNSPTHGVSNIEQKAYLDMRKKTFFIHCGTSATSHLPEFLSFSLEMYIVHQSSYDHLLHAIKARATLIKGSLSRRGDEEWGEEQHYEYV